MTLNELSLKKLPFFGETKKKWPFIKNNCQKPSNSNNGCYERIAVKIKSNYKYMKIFNDT